LFLTYYVNLMSTSNFDQNKYEDQKLISLLKEDSEYAFQLIYDQHRNHIYVTAIRFLKSPLIAQDVVQEVFLKLWFERKNIDPSKSLSAWLYTVAKNNILNQLKKVAHEWNYLDKQTYLMSNSINNTENKTIENEYNNHLQRAILALPEQQRNVFKLAREQYFTYIQIGEQLGISPLTVKTHLSRSIVSIKKYFELQGISLSTLSFIAMSSFF
jgi:RNA polymerase sigma-70 factor (family 1)